MGVILLYHRVASGFDPLELNVSPAHFAEHLEVIASLGQPCPLDELAGRGRAKRPLVAITFDDGYTDNLEIAAPLLEARGVFATVFVTAPVDGIRELWWDELARLEENRDSAFWDAFQRLRGASAEVREPELTELRARRDTHPVEHRLMTPDEVVALDASPACEIGAHTKTHPILSSLPPARQRDEIAGGRTRLADVLGHPPAAFAYPYGTPLDYDRHSVRAVREAGYAYACSNFSSGVGTRSPRFELPRVLVRDWSGEELERRLASLLRRSA